MSTEPDSTIVEPHVTDYGKLAREQGAQVDRRPFVAILDKRRELGWPTSQERRDLSDAITEKRITDTCRLVFGGQWADVAEFLETLGVDGDIALDHVVLDYFEHIGMDRATMERFESNRAARRAARKAGHQPPR